MTEKPIFVTGWFKRHGIGYLDILLAALERSNLRQILPTESPPPFDKRPLALEVADQYELAQSIGYFNEREGPALETWSAVCYLVPQAALAVNDGRAEELTAETKWARVIHSVAKSQPTWPKWQKGFEQLRAQIKEKLVFPSLDWFTDHWQQGDVSAMRALWHVINDAPVNTQVAWYQQYSPLYKRNAHLIHFIELKVDDIDDPVAVTHSIYEWLEQRAAIQRCVVNLWGTSTAVQFAWFYLAWSRPALRNAIFLKCMTPGSKKHQRFVPIAIDIVSADPIATLSQPRKRQDWEAPRRQAAYDWLHFCLSQGDNFSILLLGQRGTGKSWIVEKIWKELYNEKRPFVKANCANFVSPEHARSELFGHVKGAFTGAAQNKPGLLTKANGGMLFLDEVHRLDQISAGMLLTALQTDSTGNFSFAPLGATEHQKSQFQPIFASNHSLEQLRTKLGEDFVDRISQRIIEIPPLDKSELQDAWREVWAQMKFKDQVCDPMEGDPDFFPWLQQQPLEGSFRDLQHIAILVADYQRYKAQHQGKTPLIPHVPTLIAWLRQEMKRRRPATENMSITVAFDIKDERLTEKEYLAQCRRAFTQALQQEYGSAKQAVQVLRTRGSKMTEAKFSAWSNQKSS